MTERGILFSAPMVRALLDGSKTQTRRVCKPAEAAALSRVVACGDGHFGDEEGAVRFASPYGRPGDRLWVRETFVAYGRWKTRYNARKQRDEWYFVDMTVECDRAYRYAADNPEVPQAKGRSAVPGWHARPALFMPRAVSRILLEIVSVRVERLQDIGEADALAEGIRSLRTKEWDREHFPAWRKHFDDACARGEKPPVGPLPSESSRALWEGINGAGSWDTNPWVWVVEFKRV
jgi:hypothetical protein